MNKQKLLSITMTLLLGVSSIFAQKQPVDYVNPLMGTDSKISLSNGNTYPAIALPWGMNFWMPQTGKMGDGWAYTYASDKIRGFKQTHQPSPWINDYGQFSIMPMTKQLKIDQDSRASWFSHKAEKATPYYYSVQAVSTKWGGAIKSSYDKNFSVTTNGIAPTPTPAQSVKPKTPAVTVTAGKKQATLKWKKVSGAKGYVVYRATSKSGKYKAVSTIKKGSTVSYINKKLTSKKTYYYKVRAYRTENGKRIYSSYSKAKSAKIK